MDDDRYVVIEVSVIADGVDVLSGALWGAGALGIEERADGRSVRLLVSLPSSVQRDVEAVLTSARLAYEGRPVAADEGLDEWRRWARTVRAGRRIVVQPAWLGEPSDVTEADLVVSIDPGRSFGSGAHATTRLALELMEELVSDDDVVLDVGTGSGVLAVAAARLGAKRVVAVDIDERVRAAAQVNIAANGVSDVVELVHAPLDRVDGRFDVVVANIDAATLVGMATPMTKRVAPAGALVTSGVLVGQRAEVVAAFHEAGSITPVDERSERDWIATLWMV